VRVSCRGPRATITLNRPDRRNSLDGATLQALHAALDQAEADPRVRLVVIEGSGDHFCTGMDLEAFGTEGAPVAADDVAGSPYMRLLKRLASTDRVTLARVEGEVVGGGIGLISACDLVAAAPGAVFTLSEVLWGLLPAMVMPFLVRRVGFQPALRLTLTSARLTATDAQRLQLVDEVSADLDAHLRLLGRRLERVHPTTVGDLKRYMRRMWIVDDDMEQAAVRELARLTVDPRVTRNIKNFVELGQLPWESW